MCPHVKGVQFPMESKWKSNLKTDYLKKRLSWEWSVENGIFNNYSPKAKWLLLNNPRDVVGGIIQQLPPPQAFPRPIERGFWWHFSQRSRATGDEADSADSTKSLSLRRIIGHFRVTLCLRFKTSLRAKPFKWKWVWFTWKWTCRWNSFSSEWFGT